MLNFVESEVILSVMVVLAGIFGGLSEFIGTAVSISKSDLPVSDL